MPMDSDEPKFAALFEKAIKFTDAEKDKFQADLDRLMASARAGARFTEAQINLLDNVCLAAGWFFLNAKWL